MSTTISSAPEFSSAGQRSWLGIGTRRPILATKEGTEINETGLEGSDRYGDCLSTSGGMTGTDISTTPQGACNLIETVLSMGFIIRRGMIRLSARKRPSAIVACPHIVENPSTNTSGFGLSVGAY